MKFFIIQSIILLTSTITIAQNLEIEGFVEDAKDSTIIWFNKTVNDDYKNYLNNSDSAVLKNHLFKKSFNIKGTGFLTTNPNPYMTGLQLIVEEGNKIKVNSRRENGEFYISFQGDNALGLDELNRSIFLNFKKVNPYITEILKKTKSSDDFIHDFESIRKKLLEPFDLLLSENKITNSFYDILQLNADLKSLFVINVIVYNYKEDAKKNELNISETELNNILVKLDNKYNAFDEKYSKCDGLLRIIAVERKCQNIQNKILFGFSNNIGIWDKSDEMYNYAPIDSQEMMLANNIKYVGFKSYNLTYEKFAKIFHNSVYLAKLKQIDISSKVNEIKPYSFGFYINNSKQIDIKNVIPNIGLQELINEKFRGVSVFVDLWATYCAPCKKEFIYSDKIYNFFTKHKIEMLYVSIDNDSQIQKVIEDIYGYNLRGYHYIATNKIQQSLMKLLKEKENIYIPRYLLFNSKGELVLKNSKKPSEGQALYDQVIELIK